MVPITTVAAELARHQVRAEQGIALWIDVEGFAGAVITGAESVLPQVSLIFIEMEDKEFWASQTLAPELSSKLIDHGFVPVARDFEFRGQYNVIFCRPHLLRMAAVRQEVEDHFSREAAPLRKAAPA